MVSRSAARSYRRHRRSSHCVKLKRRTCRSTAGCKYANGRKRRYCRKARNTRRRRYKLRLRHKRRRTSVRRGGTRRRRGGRQRPVATQIAQDVLARDDFWNVAELRGIHSVKSSHGP